MELYYLEADLDPWLSKLNELRRILGIDIGSKHKHAVIIHSTHLNRLQGRQEAAPNRMAGLPAPEKSRERSQNVQGEDRLVGSRELLELQLDRKPRVFVLRLSSFFHFVLLSN